MADELERRLVALGRAEPPEPSDERIAAIEARVVAATHQPLPSRRRLPVAVAAAAVIVLLVAGLVLASGGRSNEVRLEFADGVTLERPGSATPGVAGDELPDGTIIVVAEDGLAVVDEGRFGPGRYVVVDGRLERLGPGETSLPVTTVAAPGAPATSSGDGPRRSDAPSDRPTNGPAPTTTATTSATTTTATTSGAPGEPPPTIRTVDRPPATSPGRTTVVGATTTTPIVRPTATTTSTTTSTTVPIRATSTTTTTTAPDRTTATTSRDRPPSDRP
jgi:hypothetical protein